MSLCVRAECDLSGAVRRLLSRVYDTRVHVKCEFRALDIYVLFFFFQAEDGIRDYKVTGVQTCALPIYVRLVAQPLERGEARDGNCGRLLERQARRLRNEVLLRADDVLGERAAVRAEQIGRASCRERV